MVQYDTIIRNGEIYDGSGGAPYRGDIAIKSGKIAAIADLIEGNAPQEMRAPQCLGYHDFCFSVRFGW